MNLRCVLGNLCFRGFYALTKRSEMPSEVERCDALYLGPRSQLDRVVQRELAELLERAIRTVPYYRDLRAVRPQDLSPANAFESLARMPILTKEVIRREGKRLLSEQPGERTGWCTSGGSTGEPVWLFHDRRRRDLATINKLLYMRWLGYRYGEPHLLLWGVPRESFRQGIPPKERLYRWIHHQKYLNCYRISDLELHHWVKTINHMRPTIVEAYVDAMCELSRFVLAEKLSVARPAGIIVSAGVLSPQMRQTIEAAFNCPLLNRYGSLEVDDVACSCPHSTELHVSERVAHIEVVDDDGRACTPGVEGNVLITLFTNYSMPLIRYRIEDRAVLAEGPCPCGRCTQRLAAVVGRENDYLLADDGGQINGTALTTLLFPVRGVQRFQYRQAGRGPVTLSVVPLPGTDRQKINAELEVCIDRLRRLLGATPVQLRLVDGIEPSRSGKHRYVIHESNDETGR